MDKAKMESILNKFLKNVKDHEMIIENDNGVCRSILFANPNDKYTHHFRLVTWDGGLCITSDMGTHVFERIQDMFNFFTGYPDIKAAYWGEKLKTISRYGGYRVFSWDKFYRIFEEQLIEWNKDRSAEEVKEILSKASNLGQYEEDVKDFVNYCEQEGLVVQHNFIMLEDAYEFTIHYLWCLCAISWGIKQYQDAKQS